jgi:hypothetical protein
MWSEQLALMYPMVAIFLVAAVLMLYVYYTSPKQYRIKLLLGPLLLGACVVTVPLVGSKLGYGWPAPLPVSFQYLAHKTVVVQGRKRWVDVLLISRKPLRREARLHRIPWSPQVENVLEDAERQKEGRAGGEIVVTGPPGGASGGERGPGYSITRVLPADRTPKSPPQTAPEGGGSKEGARPPARNRPELIVRGGGLELPPI